jgi:hypothetical protein
MITGIVRGVESRLIRVIEDSLKSLGLKPHYGASPNQRMKNDRIDSSEPGPDGHSILWPDS